MNLDYMKELATENNVTLTVADGKVRMEAHGENAIRRILDIWYRLDYAVFAPDSNHNTVSKEWHIYRNGYIGCVIASDDIPDYAYSYTATV